MSEYHQAGYSVGKVGSFRQQTSKNIKKLEQSIKDFFYNKEFEFLEIDSKINTIEIDEDSKTIKISAEFAFLDNMTEEQITRHSEITMQYTMEPSIIKYNPMPIKTKIKSFSHLDLFLLGFENDNELNMYFHSFNNRHEYYSVSIFFDKMVIQHSLF